MNSDTLIRQLETQYSQLRHKLDRYEDELRRLRQQVHDLTIDNGRLKSTSDYYRRCFNHTAAYHYDAQGDW